MQPQSLSTSTTLKKSNPTPSTISIPSPSSPPCSLSSLPPSSILLQPQTYAINIRLNNLLTTIKNMYDNQEIEEGVKRMVELREKIYVMRKNGKEFDRKIQFICQYNLACGYQIMAFQKRGENSLGECVGMLGRALNGIKAIGLADSGGGGFRLKLSFLKVKMLMQYCALLSQIQKYKIWNIFSHQQALQHAKQALNMLIDVFKLGQIECKQKLAEIGFCKQKQRGMKKDKNKDKDKQKDNTTIFIGNLIASSKQYLSQLARLQKFQDINQSNSKIYQKIKQNSYFWKDNIQNNCKIFKRQMKKYSTQILKNDYFENYSDCKQSISSSPQISSTPNLMRNSLGLKLSQSWIKQMNIGKIMHMNPIDYVSLIQPDNLVQQFSYKNLIEKIVWLSVIYFSLATEMRFMEPKPSSPSPLSSTLAIKKSQLFHFKSIELVCRYIKQDCPLVDHLINSYFRHYHNMLLTIEQQASLVEQSSINLSGLVKSKEKERQRDRDKDREKDKQRGNRILDQGQYMLKKVKNNCQEVEIKCQVRVISYTKNNERMSFQDSGEFDHQDLVQSQKIYRNSQKQLSNSLKLQKKQKSLSTTNLQTMKIDFKSLNTNSGKSKEKLLFVKQPKEAQKEKDPSIRKSQIKKSKSKNTHKSSKKSLKKILPNR